MYYPEMEIKIGESGESCDFLSTSSTWKNQVLSIRWLNKNSESMKNNEQKIIRYIHSKSFTPNATKRGSIYAQFLRVARNSDQKNLKNCLEELSKEYQLLGYKKYLISAEKKKVEDSFIKH